VDRGEVTRVPLEFSHAFATGDPVALAREIRAAVAHTAVP
jgi:hypothetical protein